MRIRSAIAVSLFLLAGCGPDGPGSPPVQIDLSGEEVHGLSGVVVTENGAAFLAISDRNALIRGSFEREDGRLRAARVTASEPLRDSKGRGMWGPWNDAEGLTLGSQGQIYVSFENQHRVQEYGPDMQGQRLTYVPPIGDIKGNRGFEALATDPQGRLVMIMESAEGLPDSTRAFRYENDDWVGLAHLALRDGYLPSGGDFGPDGRLYVLERRIGLLGFRSRIRQIEVASEGLMDGPIVWQSRQSFGNLEGLSLWTDAQGQIRATMVADNNQGRTVFGGMVEIILAKSAESL